MGKASKMSKASKVSAAVDTQWVCEVQPVCPCSGEEAGEHHAGFSCGCVRARNERPLEYADYCMSCMAAMVEIETDSGRVVGSGAVA